MWALLRVSKCEWDLVSLNTSQAKSQKYFVPKNLQPKFAKSQTLVGAGTNGRPSLNYAHSAESKIKALTTP